MAFCFRIFSCDLMCNFFKILRKFLFLHLFSHVLFIMYACHVAICETNTNGFGSYNKLSNISVSGFVFSYNDSTSVLLNIKKNFEQTRKFKFGLTAHVSKCSNLLLILEPVVGCEYKYIGFYNVSVFRVPLESLPTDVNIFLCISKLNRTDKNIFYWSHTGRENRFILPSAYHIHSLSGYGGIQKDMLPNNTIFIHNAQNLSVNRRGQSRSQRDLLGNKYENSSSLSSNFSNVMMMDPFLTSRIISIKLSRIDKDVYYDESDGRILIKHGVEVEFRLFGFGLTNETEIRFTNGYLDMGSLCGSGDVLHVETKSYSLSIESEFVAVLTVPYDGFPPFSGVYFICMKSSLDPDFYYHLGLGLDVQIELYESILPKWLMVLILFILLCLSGLFSGLNLGLMSLDQTELKIVQNTGTEAEKSYANKIAPIRAKGNFLLCTLLLGNVLVNNTLTILLDILTSGIIAVIGSTMGIVVFGEIIPQAICSRHGLAVGAYTIWLTKLFMVITFPLSFPISIILDKVLGTEIGTVYNKERLMELLKVTKQYTDLEKEEVDIVQGALIYQKKTVKDIMTKLEDCYMLPSDTTLNFDTMSEIREQGYSRIPVYEGERTNIQHILFAKDLMFIDPDDNVQIQMICEFYKHDVNMVFDDTPLNIMFNEFKSGEKGHMAFVKEVINTGTGDPFYNTIGLVTIEDIIEEIIQQEIVDETDIVLDNRSKKRRKWRKGHQGLETNFPSVLYDCNRRVISQQLTLAIFQYLSTTIDPFKSNIIIKPVLKKLLTLDIYRDVKVKKRDGSDTDDPNSLIIIERGKPLDCFVLILEGRVSINIGPEMLSFESGPFSYYGIQALTAATSEGSTEITSPKLNDGVYRHTNSASFDIENIPGGIFGSRANSIRLAESIVAPLSAMRRNNSVDVGAMLSTVTSASGQSTFGSHHFIPDYTVKALTDVLYMKLRCSTYIQAYKASKMGLKSYTTDEINGSEMDKMLERVNETDDSVSHVSISPEEVVSKELTDRPAKEEEFGDSARDIRLSLEEISRNPNEDTLLDYDRDRYIDS